MTLQKMLLVNGKWYVLAWYLCAELNLQDYVAVLVDSCQSLQINNPLLHVLPCKRKMIQGVILGQAE